MEKIFMFSLLEQFLYATAFHIPKIPTSFYWNVH